MKTILKVSKDSRGTWHGIREMARLVDRDPAHCLRFVRGERPSKALAEKCRKLGIRVSV